MKKLYFSPKAEYEVIEDILYTSGDIDVGELYHPSVDDEDEDA